jgi:HEAT repeat protein
VPTCRAIIIRTLLSSAALGTAACSIQSETADQRKNAKETLERYERERRAADAESAIRSAEQYQRRTSDPGSLSIEESDAQSAALGSASAVVRTKAAETLGDAKGPRAVPALIAALRSETDPAAFSAMATALEHINDRRATDPLVEALSQPGMPDDARERALMAIVAFHSDSRFVPQIRKFYESLTDESVRARTRVILARYRE